MEEKHRDSYRSFASMCFGGTGNFTVRPRSVDRTKLRQYMKNPFKNANELQEVSFLTNVTNGNYKRLIEYFGTKGTYDFLIYPILDKKKSKPLTESFSEACKVVQNMNVKYNCRWWGKKLIEQGEIYLYKISDTKGYVFQELPSNVCRINRVENNVSFYQINLKKINKNEIGIYPLEIQNIYKKFSGGKVNKKLVDSDGWYTVSDSGFAFNITGQFLSKGLPYLSFLFDRLISVEDAEDMREDVTKAENLKLIHQTIPTDNEGNVLMDEGLATIYHTTTKQNLPKGVAIATNPLKMESISLQTANNGKGVNFVDNALKSVYDSAGVNANLFNGEKVNKEITQASLIADESIAITMIHLFEAYFNFLLGKTKIKGTTWQMKMLEVTRNNQEQKIANARNNLALGGSRLEFLAVSGYTPMEGMNILQMEKELGITELFVPQQTAYTMSNNGKMQPKKDEVQEEEPIKKQDENEEVENLEQE
ncbi:hypothetical protein P5F71_07555 [Clostridium perfringens]|nr:hypothetical protein [Clostridium perfringens]